MAHIVLKNLYKTYPGAPRPAVEDLTLEISDRELVVLAGPSGCGKSTLLRMIAGLEPVTRGDIFIDGRRINDLPPRDRSVAMVFPNFALYPHLTVYRNLAFGLLLRKDPKDEIDRRVRAAAATLGLSDCLDRKPQALSGDQRLLVALGRAMVRRPRVFLLDNPLDSLDARLHAPMLAAIARLHRALGATIIYATRVPEEAAALGGRVVLLREGRLRQIMTGPEARLV